MRSKVQLKACMSLEKASHGRCLAGHQAPVPSPNYCPWWTSWKVPVGHTPLTHFHNQMMLLWKDPFCVPQIVLPLLPLHLQKMSEVVCNWCLPSESHAQWSYQPWDSLVMEQLPCGRVWYFWVDIVYQEVGILEIDTPVTLYIMALHCLLVELNALGVYIWSKCQMGICSAHPPTKLSYYSICFLESDDVRLLNFINALT